MRDLYWLRATAIAVAHGGMGSPVLGYWSYKFESVYIVPAILGSITAVSLKVVAWKALMKVFTPRPVADKSTQEFKAAA